MKGSPVIDRGEYSPSGTYWRKVAEALKKPVAPKQIKKKAVAILLAMFCVGAQAVTLSWDANSETNLAGYRVYVGKLSRQYLVSTNTTTNTTFSITGLTGTNYFAVTAFDTDGLESDYSDEVWIVLKPNPPAGLRLAPTLTVQSATAVTGPWQNVTQLSGSVGGVKFFRLAMALPDPPPAAKRLQFDGSRKGKWTEPIRLPKSSGLPFPPG